ncbi:MAG: hypothetical protein KOO65_13870, partial [Desulfobacterales bacterium]|nr:hypothetical protein [Desulfobacterales bacterium]
ALNERCAWSFVLNGAVSSSGLSLIKNEYGLISRMNQACSNHYLPQVFGIDFIKTDKGKVGFFLGEWFEGFKEFHVTEDQDRRQIAIWESDGRRRYISEADALPIYQKISRILTYYYDIETFEQIFPWHHAAGDFIVKQEEGSTQVRLITVRGYSPLTEVADEKADKKVHILPSLLFFFLNLTLRMRLDRLNGTGKAVMLGQKTIKAAAEGFLHGLDEKSSSGGSEDFRSVFIDFFNQFTLEQIIGIMENILESCHPDPLEIRLIKKNLESHCKVLHSSFKNF